MEKAFAKVHVNYEMISSGSQAEAARFLTGAPSQEFILNRQLNAEIQSTIFGALEKDFMVTAACFNDWNGLVAGNGYIVKDITIVNEDLTFVKLKNVFKPIGGDSDTPNWTGRFNLKDAKWTAELKKAVNFQKLEAEEFFLSLDDFKSGLKSYTIAYMNKDWNSSFIEKRGSVSKRLYKFNFQIGEQAKGASQSSLGTVGMLPDNNDLQVHEEQNARTTAKILENLQAHLN